MTEGVEGNAPLPLGRGIPETERHPGVGAFVHGKGEQEENNGKEGVR